MIYQVLAVYDWKARAFLPPIFTSHTDVALRALGDAANSVGHQIQRNPGDYTLFHFGVWDDDTGKFTTLDNKIELANAANLINGAQHVQQ